jgi:hypothetical protein
MFSLLYGLNVYILCELGRRRLSCAYISGIHVPTDVKVSCAMQNCSRDRPVNVPHAATATLLRPRVEKGDWREIVLAL